MFEIVSWRVFVMKASKTFVCTNASAGSGESETNLRIVRQLWEMKGKG
jgi:hypothetical protein